MRNDSVLKFHHSLNHLLKLHCVTFLLASKYVVIDQNFCEEPVDLEEGLRQLVFELNSIEELDIVLLDVGLHSSGVQVFELDVRSPRNFLA